MHLGNRYDYKVENERSMKLRLDVRIVFSRWEKVKSLTKRAATGAEMMWRHWKMWQHHKGFWLMIWRIQKRMIPAGWWRWKPSSSTTMSDWKVRSRYSESLSLKGKETSSSFLRWPFYWIIGVVLEFFTKTNSLEPRYELFNIFCYSDLISFSYNVFLYVRFFSVFIVSYFKHSII